MKNSTVIIFDSPFSFDFDVDWVRQNATELSKHYPVFFYYKNEKQLEFIQLIKSKETRKKYLESIISLKKSLAHPIVLKFFPEKNKLLKKINDLFVLLQQKLFFLFFLRFHKKKYTTIWLAFPDQYYVNLIKNFSRPKIIFDYTDKFETIEQTLEKKELVKNIISNIVENSDIIFTNSPLLYQSLCDEHKTYQKKIFEVSSGYKIQNYFIHKKTNINLLNNFKKPIIGTIASLNNRTDYSLIIRLAEQNKNFEFVLIFSPALKPSTTDFDEKIYNQKETVKYIEKLKKIKNVHIYENSNMDILPNLVKRFSIAFIPYKTDIEFNKFCNPIKFYIFNAIGKPIVSTKLPIFKYYKEYVTLAKNDKEFKIAFNQLNKKDKIPKTERVNFAKKHEIKYKIIQVNKILKKNLYAL